MFLWGCIGTDTLSLTALATTSSHSTSYSAIMSSCTFSSVQPYILQAFLFDLIFWQDQDLLDTSHHLLQKLRVPLILPCSDNDWLTRLWRNSLRGHLQKSLVAGIACRRLATWSKLLAADRRLVTSSHVAALAKIVAGNSRWTPEYALAVAPLHEDVRTGCIDANLKDIVGFHLSDSPLFFLSYRHPSNPYFPVIQSRLGFPVCAVY